VIASRTRTDTTPERKAYLKPSLEKYGTLKDLTTGGSGFAKEGSSGKKPKP
jgi:hypothetical protein